MSASKAIKKILIDKNMTIKQLAEMLGENPQVMRNRLYRDTFTYDDYVYIANLLGCDVKTIDRQTNAEYLNNYNPDNCKMSKKELNN